ncbi:MAG: hypothetical protein NTZ67_06985 [Gammaproteobacteria bacterium]|nr:hypothetical protein [Gammaproteobacteria bacterium]
MKPQKTHPIFARIAPYLMMLVMLIIFILSLFIFTYVLIFVLVVGGILFTIGFVRAKLFSHKRYDTEQAKPSADERGGRLIEYDDIDPDKKNI